MWSRNEYRNALLGRIGGLGASSFAPVAGYPILRAGVMPSFRRGAALLRVSVLVLLIFAGTVTVTARESHTMKLPSPYSFADTLARLRSTLTANGMIVFATIDHQAAARDVGLDMPPTTVLIFGNPKAGTPLMQAAPDFALDLPLRVLVREDPMGRTWLVYDAAAALEGRHGLPAGMAARLAPAEKLLAAVVQSPAER